MSEHAEIGGISTLSVRILFAEIAIQNYTFIIYWKLKPIKPKYIGI